MLDGVCDVNLHLLFLIRPEKPASEFGAGIVFSEPQPRSLRSDDPEFAFLTDLTSDMGFNLHKELTFDLEAAKLHQKALNSSPVSGAGLAIDISWLERQIKVRVRYTVILGGKLRFEPFPN